MEDYKGKCITASVSSVAFLVITSFLAGQIAGSANVGWLVFFGGLWFGMELGETSCRIADAITKACRGR